MKNIVGMKISQHYRAVRSIIGLEANDFMEKINEPVAIQLGCEFDGCTSRMF